MDTATAVTVRAAEERDAAAMAELATHLGYPNTEDEMRPRMARLSADPRYQALVAERDGRVVGFAGLGINASWVYDEPMVWLLALVVAPDEQGRGTGAALVRAGEAWAREHGGHKLMLTTALRRAGAHRFYERLGYEETGKRYVKTLA
jgi:GNAT superfamily N-acetyltransferase